VNGAYAAGRLIFTVTLGAGGPIRRRRATLVFELTKVAGSGVRALPKPPQFEHRCSNAERLIKKPAAFLGKSRVSDGI
jgi:hypothetical protein